MITNIIPYFIKNKKKYKLRKDSNDENINNVCRIRRKLSMHELVLYYSSSGKCKLLMRALKAGKEHAETTGPGKVFQYGTTLE